MNHYFTVGGSHGEPVGIGEVPDDAFDVRERPRVGALPDVGDHFVPGRL
jgi:hypothetical protein